MKRGSNLWRASSHWALPKVFLRVLGAYPQRAENVFPRVRPAIYKRGMSDESQFQRLREAIAPIMAACGHSVPSDIADTAFCGHLRRCLMSLSSGDELVGLNYQCTRTPAGDFCVIFVWQADLAKASGSGPATFMAHGRTEPLAFLLAAEMALHETVYKEVFQRGDGLPSDATS